MPPGARNALGRFVPPRRRLRGKTVYKQSENKKEARKGWPSAKRTVEQKEARKALYAKRKEERETRGVPKARKAFSIFLAHDRLKNETIYGNGNLFKIGAQRWSDLSSEQKDHYCELSKKELSAKHAAQQFYGLNHLRRRRGKGPIGLGPAAADGQASADHSDDAWKIVKEGVTMEVSGWEWKTGAAALLGHGSYGAVFRATHAATGRLAAVKVHACQSDLQYEERILRRLPPFLFPTILAVSSGPGPCAVIMQLCEKDLKKVIRAGECTETVMSCVVRQILAALSWLHSVKLVHNDVKPANILWTGLHPHVVLAGFSLTNKAGASIFGELPGDDELPPPGAIATTRSVSCGSRNGRVEFRMHDLGSRGPREGAAVHGPFGANSFGAGPRLPDCLRRWARTGSIPRSFWRIAAVRTLLATGLIDGPRASCSGGCLPCTRAGVLLSRPRAEELHGTWASPSAGPRPGHQRGADPCFPQLDLQAISRK